MRLPYETTTIVHSLRTPTLLKLSPSAWVRTCISGLRSAPREQFQTR